MKILIGLFVLLPVRAIGQKDKQEITNPDVLSAQEYKLKVKKIAPADVKFPFSSITIIDNRFDTSKLGFVPVWQFIWDKKKVCRKIVFKAGIAKGLENYYNEYYQNAFSNTDIKLLIVLKKFWFSGIDNDKNKEIDILRNEKAKSFLYCKWEYYLNRGEQYIPILRIDTVVNGVTFESEVNEDKKTNNEVFRLILNGLVEVPDFKSALDKIERLPQKNWLAIQQFNSGYYHIPVLTDTIIQRGIFINFKEFKNNRPSIINFTEKKMRLGINNFENYLEDENGNRITKYWGYYTGKDLKIGKYGNEKLYRKNYSFEFFLKHPYDGSDDVWIPYQIDMETGEIY